MMWLPLIVPLVSLHPVSWRGVGVVDDRRPALLVRAIFGISCLLLGAAMLSCQMEIARDLQTANQPKVVVWVRTVDGWERPDSWNLEPVRRPALHPVVVAAGQGLLSILGLVLFDRDDD